MARMADFTAAQRARLYLAQHIHNGTDIEFLFVRRFCKSKWRRIMQAGGGQAPVLCQSYLNDSFSMYHLDKT